MITNKQTSRNKPKLNTQHRRVRWCVYKHTDRYLSLVQTNIRCPHSPNVYIKMDEKEKCLWLPNTSCVSHAWNSHISVFCLCFPNSSWRRVMHLSHTLISHISVLCLVDKWSVKVTVVEHLRRSENTNVFLSLLPNFANTSPHFCKFCPLTKSLCRRQGAKSDRTVEQVEQLVKKTRPVIRFEKTNAFFTRPPDSAVAAVQVKVDRGEAIITERGKTFLGSPPCVHFFTSWGL